MEIGRSDITSNIKIFVIYNYEMGTFYPKKGLFNQEKALDWLIARGLKVEPQVRVGEKESANPIFRARKNT